jgi:hypothetical protein
VEIETEAGIRDYEFCATAFHVAVKERRGSDKTWGGDGYAVYTVGAKKLQKA